MPFSSKFLSYIDGETGLLESYIESNNGPASNITFYTTANMNVKGDTTRLKALVAKATALKNSKDYANMPKDRDSEYFTTGIANANKVIASTNPIWVDISCSEVKLLFGYYSAKNGIENMKDN